MQNLLRGDARIGQIYGFDILGQPCLQYPAEHGLPAADFAGHLDDAFAIGDRVNQRLQDRTPVAAFKKDVGVRGDFEGWLGQSKKRVVHLSFLPP